MTSDLDKARELYHEAVVAFTNGDVEAQESLWSQRDDVTLANPLAPRVEGFQAVC